MNDEVRFRVYSNGDIRWIKPIPATTTCDVNIARFPFDSQSCAIEISFWAMNTIDMIANLSEEVYPRKVHTHTKRFPIPN